VQQAASYAAVAHFNDGNISFLNVIQQIEITPGFFTNLLCMKQDTICIVRNKIRSAS